MYRKLCLNKSSTRQTNAIPSRTASRKNFTTVESFIAEPDSRAQCAALEENVKEFGLTYFGMTDRRQGASGQYSSCYFSLLMFL
jgi:hypothetical protein